MIKLKFITITPMHIGNGIELDKGLSYFVREKKMFKYNSVKAAKLFTENRLFDANTNLSAHEMSRTIIRNNKLISREHCDYLLECSPGFNDYYWNSGNTGKLYVHEFINSNGKAYVPGSSVKGVLLTILGLEKLGIDSDNANIDDRFVILDSVPFDNNELYVEKFSRSDIPVNLICVKPYIRFSLEVRKCGRFDKKGFIRKANEYCQEQIDCAITGISKFKSSDGKTRSPDSYLEVIYKIRNEFHNLKENETLINLGFGGSAWFKVNKGITPLFTPRKRVPGRDKKKEEAHTTYTTTIDKDISHIGWCKLRLEEI